MRRLLLFTFVVIAIGMACQTSPPSPPPQPPTTLDGATVNACQAACNNIAATGCVTDTAALAQCPAVLKQVEGDKTVLVTSAGHPFTCACAAAATDTAGLEACGFSCDPAP